jgi:aminopeptidase
MTSEERLERYADLVVRVGANVQEGQEVVLFHQVEHVPIARAVARAAYQAGARRVHSQPADLHIRKAAIEFGPEEELGVTPDYFLDWARTWRDTKPAIIQLTGNPDPGLFQGLDPALVGKAEPRDLRELYLPLVTERMTNWVIVPAPNEGWARTIFGEPDVERLWQSVATAMRLDEDDPVQAWRDQATALRSRSDALNERGFDAVRFRGPGTDLVVGLLEASRWMCATFTTTSGIEHLPNIPTEEVFTTPDWRRTTGVVRSTYPLIVPGVFARVDGLEVRFEEGRIVDVEAEGNGADDNNEKHDRDPQARDLG